MWRFFRNSCPLRLCLGASLCLLAAVSCRTIREIGVSEKLPMSHHPGEHSARELFDGPVRSVLEHRCIHCHNHRAPSGGLDLQNRERVFRGDDEGAFIVPGDPEASRIWKALLLPEKHARVMPADGWGLSLYEMQSFRAWIQGGAEWPYGNEGELEVKPYSIEGAKPLEP